MPPGSVSVPSGGTTTLRAPRFLIAWIAPEREGPSRLSESISSTYSVPRLSNARSMMFVKPPAKTVAFPVRGLIR